MNQAKLVLCQTFRLHQPSVSVDLKLTAGKERHVFAADKYQAGTLKLVPYSSNIAQVAVKGTEKRTPGQHIQLTLKTYTVVVVAASAPKPDKSMHPLGHELIVPYWLVRPTCSREQANMHYSSMKCTLSLATGKEDSADEAIVVAIMQNSRVLKEGDELFVHKEEIGAKAESLAPAPTPAARAPPRSKRVGSTVGTRLNQPKKKAMKR